MFIDDYITNKKYELRLDVRSGSLEERFKMNNPNPVDDATLTLVAWLFQLHLQKARAAHYKIVIRQLELFSIYHVYWMVI